MSGPIFRRLLTAASVAATLYVLTPTARGVKALFEDAAAATGLRFTHVNGASGQYYMAEQMGAGAALFDYDGDGDLDVFLVQSGALGAASPAGVVSRLFRNDLTAGPDGRRSMRFTDVTERAGVAWRGYGMGAAVGDYDNDGDLDLFVTSFGPEALFRNNGDGTFTDQAAAAGVSDPLWSTSSAFVDYDRDGDLDLFVANYLDFALTDNKRCADALGARDYCGPRAYRSVPDKLYRNEGNGRFTDVSEPAGIARADGAGLGVAAGDYNGDGWLDLYVANDATPNQLWINRRNGTFADEGVLSGTAFNAAGNPEGSMGIASGDPDADGDEDLFVTNISGETFVLYENDGHATFEDARTRWGVAQPTAALTGFGTDWIDYDNDGWLDLFMTNGAVNIVESQRGQPAPFRMKNLLFRNTLGAPGAAAKREGLPAGAAKREGLPAGAAKREGLTAGAAKREGLPAGAAKREGGKLTNVSAEAGPAFAADQTGRGAAFGDVDNDGDIDIVVTNNGGPVRLLINEAAAGAHWLQLRLEQPGGNRLAMGGFVGVERAGRPTAWRRVKTDGSYASASDSRIHVGLGNAAAVDAVVVHWPDGQRERWTGLQADRLVTLRRGTGTRQPGDQK